jgi:putative CocE/NonD family hydrolase
VILVQTPYNKANLRPRFTAETGQLRSSALGNTNYAFVVVDWRGRWASAGAAKPGAAGGGGQDGFDTVAWVADQEFCNGKIGGWGGSAVGAVQFNTAAQRPPNLTCIAPAVIGLPGIAYEGYFKGGVLNTERVTTLGWLFEDIYDQIIEHPMKDETWRMLESTTAVKPQDINIPVLMVSGWYDLNPDGIVDSFIRLRKHGGEATRANTTLIMGPWLHSRLDRERQGELDYPGAVGYSTAKTIEFFEHFLRGVDNGYDGTPAVHYYQMGSEEWRFSDTWPPEKTSDTSFYIQPDGTLAPAPPAADSTPSSFRFDPSKPLPTVGGANLNPSLREGPQDQAFANSFRKDVLVFQSPVLEEDLAIAGHVRAELFVSSDRPDTDFTAILVDVYPDRRQMLVHEGILRMRFREGVDREVLMEPGTVYPATVDIGHTALTLLKGHRVGVVISSSNSPRYDVNLNDGGPMYTGGEGLIATNSVYHDADHPSALILPVVAK